jgi:DNA-binding transcriptional ArsR family regulator
MTASVTVTPVDTFLSEPVEVPSVFLGGEPMTTFDVDTHDTVAADESGDDRNHSAEAERLDAIFGALSDARRRRVIRILAAPAEGTGDGGRDGTTVSSLADSLATRESGRPPTDRLAVSLRHVHLPQLDDAGVVDYDPDRSRVRYEAVPLVERLLAQL